MRFILVTWICFFPAFCSTQTQLFEDLYKTSKKIYSYPINPWRKVEVSQEVVRSVVLERICPVSTNQWGASHHDNRNSRWTISERALQRAGHWQRTLSGLLCNEPSSQRSSSTTQRRGSPAPSARRFSSCACPEACASTRKKTFRSMSTSTPLLTSGKMERGSMGPL